MKKLKQVLYIVVPTVIFSIRMKDVSNVDLTKFAT